ncbi:MAG: hypothetical protein JO165_13900, partial [Candidatus Eremiobacteraeota bacterium]|nr:hypothetical protein [Candidatus Eremiobacteraeota bacterium]
QMRDVQVRRAVIEALDVPRLVNDATRDAENATGAGRGFFGWAFDPAVKPPAYDLSGARALLRAAHWKAGTSVQLSFPTGDAQSEQVALMMQQELRQVGVELSLRKYTLAQFLAPADSGGPIFGSKYQIAFVQILTGVDPNTGFFFDCNQMPPAGFNLTRYCNANIQAALEADVRTYDPELRRRESVIVQQQVASAVPFVPLWQRHAISVYPSWLHGVDPSPTTAYWNIGEWHV